MKNLSFSSRPRAKVRCQGPLGSARAQPWRYRIVEISLKTYSILYCLSQGFHLVFEYDSPPLWLRANAPYSVAISQCLEKEGILDMAWGNVHFQQQVWGYFAFKICLLQCSDGRSLPLVEKICDSMGFWAANHLRVDKVRTASCFSVFFTSYYEESERGQTITAKKTDLINEFTPKNTGIHQR